MNKKNIYILIFAIVFFIGSLIFFLSTLSNDTTSSNNNSNNDKNNQSDNNLIEETSPFSYEDTTSLADTTNISDTSDSTSANSANDVSDTLIDFTYYNKENKEFNISEFQNKPMAILFTDFSEKYDSCVESLSLLNSFYDKYNFKVQFLCIDKTTSATADSDIKIYKDKNGIENYLIETLPTLVFIDKDGEIVDQNDSITFEYIESNLELITETENV